MKERARYSANSLLGSGLISSRVSFLGIMPAAGLMPISAVVLVALNSLQGNIRDMIHCQTVYKHFFQGQKRM